MPSSNNKRSVGLYLAAYDTIMSVSLNWARTCSAQERTQRVESKTGPNTSHDSHWQHTQSKSGQGQLTDTHTQADGRAQTHTHSPLLSLTCIKY